MSDIQGSHRRGGGDRPTATASAGWLESALSADPDPDADADPGPAALSDDRDAAVPAPRAGDHRAARRRKAEGPTGRRARGRT
ncbi:hypothetical protein ABT084_25795, partial [Streptomyces sp. NPDC002138]